MGLARFSAAWREEYVTAVTSQKFDDADDVSCVFCVLAREAVGESSGVLWCTPSVFVTLNAFPYGSGHLLVLPTRHVATLEELRDDEYYELCAALRASVRSLTRAYDPDGMNVGFNIGAAAGAGIPGHLHAHALPRWNGDTNFMTAIAETRVLPESLTSTWRKVHDAWDS